MTNTPFTRRSTAVHELRLTAQVIAGLPTQPHAPDQWTVVFVDFGHDLLVLGTHPTPDPGSELAADQFAVLHAQDLSSYEVTASSAADAERRARAYFAAERMGVAPWSELGYVVMPGTPIPAEGGPDALRIAINAFAARGLTPYHDDDAGNTWMVIGPDRVFPGKGVSYAVLYVYNPTSDEGEEEITVDRPLLPSDEWRIDVGDGYGNEKHLMKRPVSELADCVDAIVALLAERRN
ncbi:hypothetical protein [Streptomyces ureilyticus]|uniref:Uncharacterized protein n=1 Tax=Streptomyces ureilyticus TaxID=1775131 RepID=A0ABX0DN84_9ACTN|nr:hypothetical protein [Streptomyces ureilyticus]NGO40606.1 hypothetical protein [Streptomyces ureilyticus]